MGYARLGRRDTRKAVTSHTSSRTLSQSTDGVLTTVPFLRVVKAKLAKQRQLVSDLTAQMAAKKAVEAAQRDAKCQERAAVLAEVATAEAQEAAAAAAARAFMLAVRADRQQQVPRPPVGPAPRHLQFGRQPARSIPNT